ncbi:FAD-dependent pyridine nucleotide-disulfide oxidoreductase [Rhizobium tropici]|uniref:FAD-dependent pyridine nucleotide-disulfide oxidoreductase n=1 Tax=Rhizobium tropici TaxID=398 RepID=A0A5B0VKZ9_RHITR|nr:FAD/NAD(P)-binding protein [Rhizobium tropici]KAA1175342.1 FAD-dependent pyridine nucleotide-disulfide oxidoreductase [Rhizobium tropici]
MIYDAVVVGSGFSAISIVCNLVELLPETASIAIVGDDPGFGRGTAYRTELYLHRLNVPAGRMSLFPDRPNAFVEWLREHKRPLDAGDFASRQDYGLYIRDSLAALLRNRKQRCRVDFIKAKATGCVERYRSALGFLLDNGDEIAGRNIVLCLGVGNAQLPFDVSRLSTGARSHIIENPWRLSWLRQVGKTDTICILGSGLTMIDQVLALSAHGFMGKIVVLSRRGLVPHDHASHPKPAVEIDVDALPTRMSELLHILRRESGKTGDWRRIMDGLRPKTQTLWSRLPELERRRFLRHALPWWNIHRHRVAPDVFRRFEAMMRSGKVSVRAGYLQNVEEAGPLALHYRPRGRSLTASIEADWIVNCTGMERAGIAHSPLLQEMQRKGLIEADPLRLGLTVDAQSRVPGSIGKDAVIYAVGALTAGQFWEITAVPDIRVQARKVAEAIAGGVR